MGVVDPALPVAIAQFGQVLVQQQRPLDRPAAERRESWVSNDNHVPVDRNAVLRTQRRCSISASNDQAIACCRWASRWVSSINFDSTAVGTVEGSNSSPEWVAEAILFLALIFRHGDHGSERMFDSQQYIEKFRQIRRTPSSVQIRGSHSRLRPTR